MPLGSKTLRIERGAWGAIGGCPARHALRLIKHLMNTMITLKPKPSRIFYEIGRFWNRHLWERQEMERQIVHIDVDSFAITVERIVDSKLRNRPVIVANPVMARSVVQALSTEAQQAGIYRGMMLQQALRLCRDVKIIPPNEPLYSRAMRAIMNLLSGFSPLIEPVRYGHVYLDMTGTTRLFGSTMDVAAKIQHEIQSQLRLPSCLGVASNKLVSKVASKVSRPVGIQEVQHGSEENFMWTLEVHYLPLFNQSIKTRLLELNLRLIKQIAMLSLHHLAIVFGRDGLKLYRASHGIDYTPVFPPQQVPNIYEQTTLTEDTNDIHLLRGALYSLVEKVGRQLRQTSQSARKMMLEIYYADHREAIGQKRLPKATSTDQEFFQVAEELLNKILTRRIRVRKLAVRYFELGPAAKQVSLFDKRINDKNQNLTQAIDQIRKKFGEDSVKYALTK